MPRATAPALLLWLMATLPGLATAADPLEGRWRTTPDGHGRVSEVMIAPCGEGYCGTLVATYDSSGRELESDRLGRFVVWGMRPQGGGRYERGQMYAADVDRIYASRMALKGDSLSVSGCVLVVCRGQLWQRQH